MNREKLYDCIMLEHRNLIQVHKKLYEAQHLPPDAALDEVAGLLTDAALLAEKTTCRLRNLLFDTAPTPDTRAYDLLTLTALSGEYPASSVSRLVGSTAYAEKVVSRLKADGLLRTVYRDRLRGYRVTAAAKHRLLAAEPRRFAFYLTGSTDTNRVKSEPVRRLRLHRVAQMYTSVYKAEIPLFRDDKPCPFSAAVLHLSAPTAFYASREVKEMGIETVKIRGSRMAGVLAALGRPCLCYNCAGNMPAFDRQSELRAKVFFQNLARRGGAAQVNVTGLLFADRIETLGQVLAQAHTRDREYFLFGEGCEPFYFLTNDHYGDVQLRLLCNVPLRQSFLAVLRQGFTQPRPGGQIEHDAMTTAGQPVLSACLPDLPRLFRFCSALELYDRQGVLVCFDFQAAALKQGRGDLISLQLIDFDKFERGFLSI